MKKCKNLDCEVKIDDEKTYCSFSCRNSYVNRYLRDYSKNKEGLSKVRKDYYDKPKKCKNCNNTLDYSKRRNIFCSSSCSASFNNSKREYYWGVKIGNTIKKLWDEGHYDLTSRLNHLKQPKYFTSKNERNLVRIIKQMYPNDEWTSGGRLKYKGEYISRDLYSDKLKVCVEYDGIWHFEDIKGQLENKQRKDGLLEDWCTEHGYKLLRVDENYYNSPEEIIKLIYTKDFDILKLGDRYK